MSIPRKHHYLPQSYLDRWAGPDAKVYSFVRPRGAGDKLDVKAHPVSAVAYQRDLYRLPEGGNERYQQRVELEFLQRIDDRAAVALDKLDNGVPASLEDRVGLAQFLLSLLHRTPGRLQWLHNDLARRMADVPNFDPVRDYDLVRRGMLDVFVDMVGSDQMVAMMYGMKVYRMEMGPSRFDLLTSDRPTMLSNGLDEQDGFLMLPYSPRRIVILAHDKHVPDAFTHQDPDKLVRALNDAVVSQAEHVVIGRSAEQRRFIENRFLFPTDPLKAHAGPDGIHRWEAPL
ncbi:MAG TPA: DUF4238 domain-containing protein [Sphingobium sp.]|uniref:DUF4238 domain-containing protein n=1 Tax=Sphingobium sp. TaxID=1912891 RepID=UPI002ED45838